MRCFDEDTVSFQQNLSGFRKKLAAGVVVQADGIGGGCSCGVMDGPAEGSDGDKQVNVKRPQMFAYRGMKGFSIRTEFAHVAQYGHFSCERLIQHVQHGAHGDRVGVVAVVNEGVAPGVQNVASAA